MLSRKDICLIIPTYNRATDVDRSMSILMQNDNIPGKIIIIDQTKDDSTKNVCKKYSKKLPLKYIFSSKPSSSIAENIGVEEGRKNHQLLLIAGDDVDFLPGYMDNLLKEFNENPNLMGLGGPDKKSEDEYKPTFLSKLSNIYFKIFLLPSLEDHKTRIVGPYGNTNSIIVNKPIRDAEWLPGFNNCFKREIYNDYSFPVMKGYNVLEDIDCSYRVFRKYGKGSLIISPACKVIHRESRVARYPEKKRIFANHEDHFAFYYRYFNNFLGTLKMFWSLTGIILGNFLNFAIKPKKDKYDKLKFNIQAIVFCLKNRKLIKKGIMRSFLNEDLTLKPEYA